MPIKATALFLCLSLTAAPCAAASVETHQLHGYTPFGELKYPKNFQHLDYVNPDAPKGGSLKLNASGTFDSLNPYILKGMSLSDSSAYLYGFLEMTDSLLAGASPYHQSGDEPQSAYGLIAESIEYPDDLSWCTFTLRKQARFSDGTPITANDVIFSFNTLKTQGHPRYAIALQNVTGVEKLSEHKVRFTFTGDDRRALPLTVGQLPVLPAHYWKKVGIDDTSFTAPVASSPYRVGKVVPGKQIVLMRNENYWAKDLPLMRGRFNFDTVTVDFYRDAQVAFEAFKSNGYDVHLDYIAKHWATAYDFPAINDGRVKRKAMPNKEPQGTQAFFLNLRHPQFQDARVRQALNLLFDYEWTNKTIFNSAYQRMETWFPNSDNAATGIPTGKELAVLEKYRKQLPDQLFSKPFSLPTTDGSGHNRNNARIALNLLKQAGWEIRNQELVNIETGEPFTLSVMINHNPGMDRVIQPWLRNLQQLGIQTDYRSVDPSTYKQRMDNFDFDVTVLVLPQQAFPGAELKEYFHSSHVNTVGGSNYSGISDPVIDDLVQTVMAADNLEDYRAGIHALDRVLSWRYYVIPHWYLGKHRIAWWDKFGRPEVPSPYSVGTDTWWSKTAQ